VRRPDAGKALSLRFDHGAEVVSTQGTLLLEMGSDEKRGLKNGVRFTYTRLNRSGAVCAQA
jgi:hypothetical protein